MGNTSKVIKSQKPQYLEDNLAGDPLIKSKLLVRRIKNNKKQQKKAIFFHKFKITRDFIEEKGIELAAD